jgi:hypothetical protein
MALHTAWTPLARGGSNFRSHKLDCSNPQRWTFRMSVGGIVLSAFFVAAGVGIFAASFWQGEKVILMRIFGLAFAAAGAGIGWSLSAPTVFDKQRGYFCKGRKAPESVFDRSKLKNHTELERIHALQLIAELLTKKNNSSGGCLSYELNLVLIDGSRLNVIDHGGQADIREDARKLAGFLGKPLWDATA